MFRTKKSRPIRMVSVLLSLVLLGSMFTPAALAQTQTAPASVQVTADTLPEAQWQANVSFPDWAGYVDDTLAMNSLYSFSGFSGQGEMFISVAEDVSDFDLFINNVKVDTADMAAGGTYRLDYSAVALNGTNTLQVSNIHPDTATEAVTAYIPYPIVLSGNPQDVGMDPDTLDLVNDLINAEIKYGFSGAELAVIKDGRLVVNEAYGAANGWRQDGTRIMPEDADYVPVTTDTLFDLASNTKMYTVNYALQYMLSQGGYDIGLDDPITKFFPTFDDEGNTVFKSGTTEEQQADILRWKSELTLRDILMHQAGFDADPQYHNDNFNSSGIYDGTDYPLYSQDRDTTLQMILKSPLTYEPGSETVYSDVDYMLLCFIIEQVTGQRLDAFLKETFWEPMGLTHVTYNPLDNGFDKEDTAATELCGNTRAEAFNGPAVDFSNIRTETIWGEVHDEKAYYAMDGVSGHAGLFSNAEDLAKLCSIMLTGGYGDLKFFDKNTIDEFTKPKSTDYPTYGLGWWRNGNLGRQNYFTSHASTDAFGHQGWTGTLTVIDPERNLVVVLLTNKKNSPVLDNTVNANDFYGDNMVLGNLGCVVGYIYESMDASPDAMDASIAQFAKDRMLTFSTHKDQYDECVHMADAFALTDLVVTRAEKRRTDVTLAYAKDAVRDLRETVASAVGTTRTLPDTKTRDCDIAETWLDALDQRVNAITDVSAAQAPQHVLQPTPVADALPMITSEGEFVSGHDQNAVYFPRAYGTGTSTCYSNGVTWFEGYAGQGEVFIAVRKSIPALQIYINGVPVDTSAMLNLDDVHIFKIDVSSVARNGRNTIQVSGMPIATARGADDAPILLAVANPVVVEGTMEEVGINPDALELIDRIITSDVANGFTSAQLVVVKDGKRVVQKAWGLVNSYHPDGTPVTQGDDEYAPVTSDTLYDLASNTKMYATNYAIQKLVDGGQIALSDKITKYLGQAFVDDTLLIQYETGNGTGAPDIETAKAWKEELTVADILQHQAGFAPDPQFHNDKFNQVTQTPDPEVDNPLYAIGKENVKAAICKAPLVYEPGTKTVYSDVDYMLLGLIVEQVTGKSLDQYVEETFYAPLGLTHVTYNPLSHGFDPDQIAATELHGNTRDGAIAFTGARDYTLQGEVHDEKAWYAMEGVSGHAGLFSNATDLATLAQVTLNYSGYGDNFFWNANTLDYFTDRKNTSSTFGQGWWREGDMGRPWYFGVQSSRDTVGHQGWTGTLTVIDPASDLIIVYLTNKINSPVTNPDSAPNTFDGNWYTSSTLGFVANILYMGLEENDASGGDIKPALDSLLEEMNADMARRVAQAGDLPEDHPLLRAAQAIADLVP